MKTACERLPTHDLKPKPIATLFESARDRKAGAGAP
jgi:hypothetical protein